MKWKLLEELRRTQCHTRVFVAWFLVSAGLCLIYAIVVYASLVNKNILPSDPGPDKVPFTNVPKRYNVTLRFDSTSNHTVLDYSGEMRMIFTVREASQRIFVNAGSMVKIGKCLLWSSKMEKITLLKGVYNSKTEIQTLIPQTNLIAELDYTLSVEFIGKLNQDAGPKSFSYISTAGEKRYGVYFSSPAFSSSGLRYLFPAMDSNQFPAMFDVTIYRKNTLRAISNFAGVTTTTSGYLVDSFLATVRLYPAQIGVVLCDFPFQKENIDGTMVTLYYRPNVISQVNLRRLKQFMDKSSITIGKLDATVLPSASTVNLPGLSILNEKETVAENQAINGLFK